MADLKYGSTVGGYPIATVSDTQLLSNKSFVSPLLVKTNASTTDALSTRLFNTSSDNFVLMTGTNTPNPNWSIGYGNGAGVIDVTKESISSNGGYISVNVAGLALDNNRLLTWKNTGGTGCAVLTLNSSNDVCLTGVTGGNGLFLNNSKNMHTIINYNSTGFLGVGTGLVPGYLLDVYNNSDVWHASFGGATGRLKIGGQTTSNNAVIQATNHLLLQRDGNYVGIGTSTPLYHLDIYNGSSSVICRLGSSCTIENVVSNQALFGRNVVYNGSWVRINAGYAQGIRMNDDPGDGSIIFHLGTTSTAGSTLSTWDSSDRKVTIRNNGYVGISDGVQTPGCRLDVIDDSATCAIRTRHSNLTQGISIGYNQIVSHGTSADFPMFIDSKGTGILYLNNTATGRVSIGLNGLNVGTFRTQEQGNVLINASGATDYTGTNLTVDNDRPTIQVEGNYPNILIKSNTASASHGSTLGLWTYDGTTTRQWNIGTGANGWLSIGYSTNNGNPHVGIYDYVTNSVIKIDPGTDTPVHFNGNIYTDRNYGFGLVGLYASTIYQGIFAMGDGYKLTAAGGIGNLYGICWTHTNVGGQSKAGLHHQALFCNAGTTQTAIGTGIWTLGQITSTLATGTSPFAVTSTTVCTNLNANYVEGAPLANIVHGENAACSIGHTSYTTENVFALGSGFIDSWSVTTLPTGTTHVHGFQTRHNNLSNNWGIQVVGSYAVNSLWHRVVNAGTWGSWYKIWSEGNHGAGSGMNADMVDGYHASTSATASTVPVRDGNGYIFNNFFNMTADVTGSGPSHVCVGTNSDGYLRWQTLATFKTNLGVPTITPFSMVYNSTSESLDINYN